MKGGRQKGFQQIEKYFPIILAALCPPLPPCPSAPGPLTPEALRAPDPALSHFSSPHTVGPLYVVFCKSNSHNMAYFPFGQGSTIFQTWGWQTQAP